MKKIGLIALAVALLVGGLIAVPDLIGPKASSVQAASASNIATAITNGLTWLAAHQQTTGDTKGAWYFYDDDSTSGPPDASVSAPDYDLGVTGLAVTKFEEYAKEQGQDPISPADPIKFPYATNVINGLDYIFNNLQNDTTTVSGQNLVHFPDSGDDVYDTAIDMMALAASNNPTRVVDTGPLKTSWTYKPVLQAMMNYIAYAQEPSNLGDLTGGWGYTAQSDWSDESNTGYAAIGMGFASEAPFSLTIPSAVLTGLNTFDNAVQITNSEDPSGTDVGGADYQPGADSGNIYRTGSLLYQLALCGYNATSTQTQAAVQFIENYWITPAAEDNGGWTGDYQAMYTLMKGLVSQGITNLEVGGSQIDWFGQVSDYIIANQNADGSWLSTEGDVGGDSVLDTAWALLTLEKAVAPVATYTVTVTVAPTAAGTAASNITGNTSPYHAGDSVSLTAKTVAGYTFKNWTGDETGTNATLAFTMPPTNINITANYTPAYTVTYNGNSNTGGTVPVDSNSYISGATVTVLGNTGSLVRTGYTFAGWNTVANGSGTAYVSGNTFAMGSANVILYAQWTAAPTYTVTYNGNSNTGGTVPVDSNSYINGATVTVLGNTGSLVRTGYTFAGWNTAANGSGTAYVSGNTFAMGSVNVTLYAQWTAATTYTVTYNGNSNTGGTVPVDSNSYISGATVTVLGNTGSLVRTGYTFAGWNTAANGSGTAYVSGNTFDMGSANVTLYAQWTAAATYTVTYNGNSNTGGTVPVDSNSYINGATVTVLGNTGSLVRTGYTFTGWNTVANGSGTAYVGGNTFAMGSANVTLYAQWTAAPTYTVTYNGNSNTGGAVPVDSNSYINGATVTVLGNTGSLVRTGYTFTGWNTAANGSGTAYVGGNTFAMGSANVILYAQWTAATTYTVTYNGNSNTGGAVPVDSNSYISGTTVTVLGNTGSLVRTGYTFTGWNTAANGSGTAYVGGNTFAMGSVNVTLYAQWTAATTYTVTYNGNNNTGGAVPVDSNSYISGATVTVLGNTGSLVRTGYTFAGWNTAANGSGTAYAGGNTFAMGSANVILYAQWTAATTYTVTYNGNSNTGGTVPVDSNSYINGATVTVLGNTGSLVRTGYTFAGWNTAANGSGTAYVSGNTFAMGSANVILYAQWIAGQTYTVTATVAPSAAATASCNITGNTSPYGAGASVSLTANTVAGWTFSGWTGDETGSNATLSFTMPAKNVSVTANYTQTTTPTCGATLSNLTICSGTLTPVFASATTAYTDNVANDASYVDVTPTATDSNATITVNGTKVASGSAYGASLKVGVNTIIIVVTAQDGTTTKTYTVKITRAAPLPCTNTTTTPACTNKD